MKRNLKEYPIDRLKKVVNELGLEQYRADQIFNWIWQKHAEDFDVMTNLSKTLRTQLSEEFEIAGLNRKHIFSAQDGSEKYLFKTLDNKGVEAVFIPDARRKTVCVSSQIGCPLKCQFCATGLMGFSRNLKAHEMADEVRLIQIDRDCKITNIVFMGMGEPLMNLREVITAIDMCSSPLGLSIGQRHTTVSTAGLIDGMRNLLNTQLKVKLAISLNFPDEDMRNDMMPVNRNNPLKEILQLAREFSLTRSMVTFEYVLIARMNDSINHAKRLLNLIKGIPSKINLISYNPVSSLPFKRPPQKTIERFYQYLLNSHHTVTLRKSKGIEIHAACGQLSSADLSQKEGKDERF